MNLLEQNEFQSIFDLKHAVYDPDDMYYRVGEKYVQLDGLNENSKKELNYRMSYFTHIRYDGNLTKAIQIYSERAWNQKLKLYSKSKTYSMYNKRHPFEKIIDPDAGIDASTLATVSTVLAVALLLVLICSQAVGFLVAILAIPAMMVFSFLFPADIFFWWE